MRVFIGVDPHKPSVTIEVVDERETVLATGRFGTDKAGYAAKRKHVAAGPERTSAVEGSNGAGRPWLSGCWLTVSAWSTCRPSSAPERGCSTLRGVGAVPWSCRDLGGAVPVRAETSTFAPLKGRRRVAHASDSLPAPYDLQRRSP